MTTEIFSSFKDLWDDIEKFMKENPNHVIICVDDPGKSLFGWVAYIPNSEDEQQKYWSISTRTIHQNINIIPREMLTAEAREMLTAEGRLSMCKSFNKGKNV